MLIVNCQEMPRLLRLILIPLLILQLSCKHEAGEIYNNGPYESINKAYYYLGDAIYDSARFTYTNNQLRSIDGNKHLATFVYSGERISSRKYIDKTVPGIYELDT